MSADELLEHTNIVRALGYPVRNNILDEGVAPRGYRILSKIPRLPAAVIENMLVRFQTLPRVMTATIEELDEVEGIGAVSSPGN